jgi:hypothetical protein
MAVPTIVATTTVEDASNATSRNIAVPAGGTTNDWYVLVFGCDGANTITATDFTQIITRVDPDESCRLSVYARKYTGGEGANFALGSTASEQANAWCALIRGVPSSITTPADIFDAISVCMSQPMGTTACFFPQIYAETDDTLGIVAYVMDGGIANTGTTGTPSGFTSSYQDASGIAGVGISVATQDYTTSGYKAKGSFTPSAATDSYICVHLAIKSTTTADALPNQPVLKCMEYFQNTVLTGSIFASVPFGSVENNALILTGNCEFDHFSIDADFTAIQTGNTGTAVYGGAWYSICDGSLPSTYSVFTSTSSAKQYCLMRFINNARTSAFVDASSKTTGTTDSSAIAPSVTPTVDNCFILRLYGNDDDDVTYDSGYPASHTGLFCFPSTTGADLGFTGAYTTQTTKTSTGTATKTLNAAEEWWAMTVALAPYVSSGTTYNDSLTESATASDTETAIRTASASFTESSGATDTNAATRSASPAVSESAAATDSFASVKILSESLTESATASDSVSANKTNRANLSESAASTDSVAVAVTSQLSATETATASDTQAATKRTAESISETAAATDNLTGSAKSSATYSDSAASTDEINGIAIATGAVTETGTVADSYTETGGGGQNLLSETASANDSYAVAVIQYEPLTESAAANDNYDSSLTPSVDQPEEPVTGGPADGAWSRYLKWLKRKKRKEWKQNLDLPEPVIEEIVNAAALEVIKQQPFLAQYDFEEDRQTIQQEVMRVYERVMRESVAKQIKFNQEEEEEFFLMMM